MKRAIGKCWRDSASLIVLAKRNVDVLPRADTREGNYDILLQTRTHSASFSNSVVFPGGVSEEADASEHWLELLSSFGYSQHDFANLHPPGAPASPIFSINPVRRHIALRISAIRETFEELGLLICCNKHKTERSHTWAHILSDIDVKHWQNQVSKNPAALFNLCKEHNCYPDIWALNYWSNWLSPVNVIKRFDTAFFITALKEKPTNVRANSEVVKVEWSSPLEALQRNTKNELQFYPPQGYELYRLSKFNDIEKLIQFAKDISYKGNELYFPVRIQAKDGIIQLMPGDHLYPTNVDPTEKTAHIKDKTINELRDTNKTLHRFELTEKGILLVTQNYIPKNHINMDDLVMPFNVTIHKTD